MRTYEITTTSEDMTKEISAQLGKMLRAGDIITLEGDLGAGKTTFTKGLAVGMEVERIVTSPTFTIIKQYVGRLPLYHIDAYRLEHSEEDIGFDEYFYGEGVSVVEWAKFIEDYLPENRLAITLYFVDEMTRKLTFTPTNEHYEQILIDSKIM